MRPVELTVEGLRSFRRPVTIDFADRELIAVVGDTGAGKSSILEAVTWALYGNATWTKQAGVLVGDGCPQMRVRLAFKADGHTWQVTRAVKRRQDGTVGPANAELVCLDGDRPAADGVRQVNPAVQEVVGLDWDAFTRTVVLPQGQFARLLTEGDVDRMRILAQIWRTDELVAARARADEALRELSGHLDYLRGRRRSYPDDADAELAAARTRVAEAEAAAARTDALVAEAGRCGQVEQAAARRAGAIAEAVVKVRDAAPRDLTVEADRVARTATDLDEQRRALDERIAAREQEAASLAVEQDDGGPDRRATQEAAATLEGLSVSLDDLARHRADIDGLRRQAEEQAAAAAALARDAREAAARADAAQKAVDRLQRLDAAAAAAHGLHRGDDCPVCARALPEGWEAPDASGLSRAVAEHRAATSEAQQAARQHAHMDALSGATAEQAGQRTARLEERLGRVAAAVAGLPEPFRPALPTPFTVEAVRAEQLTDDLVREARAAAQARLARFEERDTAERRAQQALQRLRDQRAGLRERRHDQVTEPATRLRARLRAACEQVEACARAGVRVPSEVPVVGQGLGRLAADARAVAEVVEAALAAAQRARADAEQESTAAAKRLRGLFAEAGVASADDLAERQVGLRADARQARQRADDLARMVPVVEALDRHLARGDDVAGALTDLKTLLQDGRFIRWLTLRRSRALLAVASTLLDEMTAGRYAFADITDEHDEWRVFDHETGYARSPRTLSGGESFVASLALALGMVEMVARSGGRLDALFLDEGFGALDRENLDAAVDALESSATRGRMVAVISHVQAVAERLTEVLAVDRDPSGSQARWLDPEEREGLAVAGATSAMANLVT